MVMLVASRWPVMVTVIISAASIIVTIITTVGSTWLELAKHLAHIEEREKAIEQQLLIYAADHDRLVIAVEQLRIIYRNSERYGEVKEQLPYQPYDNGGRR